MDIDPTIIRQYFTSPRLRRILEDYRDNLDPTPFIELLTENWLDPRTATQWGLDIWGRIVGVSRYLSVSADKFIGYEEAGDLTTDTYGYAIWYNGFDASGTTLYLADDLFRQLIYAKAWSNNSDRSIRSLNGCLQMLFGSSGGAYAQDNHDGTITIVMNFIPTAAQTAIITQTDVLPVRAGVSYTYEINPSVEGAFILDKSELDGSDVLG